MSNSYDYTGRARGALELVGRTREEHACVGRARDALEFVGVSDVLGAGGGVPPAVGTDPESIASLANYLDARDLALADGANVTTWGARVGIGAVDVSAGAQTFAEDAMGAGADAVQWAGTRGMSWDIDSANATWTLAVLMQSTGDVNEYLFDAGSNPARSLFIPSASTQGGAALFYDGTASETLARRLDDGMPHLLVVSADAVAGVRSVYVDGELVVDAAPYSPSALELDDDVTLGAQSNKTSSPYSGLIAAVWHFEGQALTDAEIGDITTFVRDDWGLPLAYAPPTPPIIGRAAYRWRASSGTYQDVGATTAVAASGDPIGTWVDEIQGYQLEVTSTARRPALATIGTTRVVDFDGVDDFIADVAGIAFRTANDDGYSMLIVRTQETSGLCLDSAAGSDNIELEDTSSPGYRVFSRGGGTQVVASNVAAGSWHSVGINRTGDDLGDGAGYLAAYEDGVEQFAVNGYSTTLAGLNRFGFGSRSDGALPWGGSIVEVILFEWNLQPKQWAQLHAYVVDTYGADLGIT